MNEPVISVSEARKILGKDAEGMSDAEIADVIGTLDLLAKDALETARQRILMKRDARDLANLIYDVYQEEKHTKRPPQ